MKTLHIVGRVKQRSFIHPIKKKLNKNLPNVVSIIKKISDNFILLFKTKK